MCGISGFFAAGPLGPDAQRELHAMNDSLAHRGPDDADVWHDADAGIALAHRRLSIIDLSPEGRQPMHSRSRRYVTVFNGEIYNFRELQADLLELGAVFRGHSDTEVLLAAVDAWGLDETLRRANGMFAFALWDRHERVLHLARDRIGKKPLYYGWAGDTLLFGSELKALLAHSRFEPNVDPHSLALFLRYNYVPAPWSMLRGVFKLQPGAVLTMRLADVKRGADQHMPARDARRYWDAHLVVAASLNNPLKNDVDATLERLDALLTDAVALRMHADVPLGAFLSGGTDSSTTVALMQAQSSRPIKTFSIGFHDERHDEAREARAVAKHLQTDHTELYVTGEDALAIVPQLPRMFDEPFADSSQIPTFLVAQLARQHVTVALSGDGGDELFGGYGRYERAMKVWRWLQRVPAPVRRALSAALQGQSGREGRTSKLAQLASELRAQSLPEVYRDRVSRWRYPESVVFGGSEHPTPFTDPAQQLANDGSAHALMFLDLITYLPEDILTKVDRATMAVGLEARAPILDYRVIELAFRIPLDMKIRDGQQKWILKRLLRRYLPDELVYRPKKGFGAPVAQWLKGPLREWAGDLLSPARLAAQGHLEPGRIEHIWTDFLNGERKWHTHLWNVLMFQAWIDWIHESRRSALASHSQLELS
jgi:asparagine synthase (glutamine-hydrolysing)